MLTLLSPLNSCRERLNVLDAYSTTHDIPEVRASFLHMCGWCYKPVFDNIHGVLCWASYNADGIEMTVTP
jgi:hypothetical protein